VYLGLQEISAEGVDMPAKSGRAWKNERASVSRGNRPRSNKYRDSDQSLRPGAGSRSRIWVGGYTRDDGTKVTGYYRKTRR
jgi:hypothetical protein